MDIITMKLIENKLNIPLDLLRYINTFIYEKLNDENIKQAVELWFENKEECLLRFGHISHWNTIRITNMSEIFKNRYNFFNQDQNQ